MAYRIPADISQRIDSLVAGGAFQSEDEVLHEAIGTLENRLCVMEVLRRDI